MTIRAYDNAGPPPGGPPPGGRGRDLVRNDMPVSWETSSALSTVRGIPWWAAVLLALAFTGIGVFADLERINRLGLIFQISYVLGCVFAVLWVQRRGLFGPMVQPPLILVLAVPVVVLTTPAAGSGGGLTATALAVGTPLINSFPTMAITTGSTVLIGLIRIAMQRAPARVRVRTTGQAPGRPGADRGRPLR
jgi:hypothetical protein